MLTTHPKQHQQREHPLVKAIRQVVDCHQHLGPQGALPAVVVVAASMLAGDCNIESIECFCIMHLANGAFDACFVNFGRQAAVGRCERLMHCLMGGASVDRYIRLRLLHQNHAWL